VRFAKPASDSSRYRVRRRHRERWLVKEHELYVPLTRNDGSAVAPKTIERIGERLLDEFGGVTFFPQPNVGQ